MEHYFLSSANYFKIGIVVRNKTKMKVSNKPKINSLLLVDFHLFNDIASTL